MHKVCNLICFEIYVYTTMKPSLQDNATLLSWLSLTTPPNPQPHICFLSLAIAFSRLLYNWIVYYVLSFLSGFFYSTYLFWDSFMSFSSVQLLSHVQLFATPWTAAYQAITCPSPAHPCPSQTPGVYPKSCQLSRWCHPTISSSVIPFSSCPQSFPAPGSFQMNQLFASCGQSIGVSASASVLPMNTQDWSPLGWTGWISFQSKELKSLLQHHSSKASILQCSAFFIVQLSHLYMTTGKTTALTRCWSWNSNTLATWCGELDEMRMRMVGWHHQHNGHGFGWTLGVGDGQGGLACCSSWGHKESDTTEQLNWTELIRWTFVGKVMSLLFNMLSRCV